MSREGGRGEGEGLHVLFFVCVEVGEIDCVGYGCIGYGCVGYGCVS